VAGHARNQETSAGNLFKNPELSSGNQLPKKKLLVAPDAQHREDQHAKPDRYSNKRALGAKLTLTTMCEIPT
jgi:hypothetical protein